MSSLQRRLDQEASTFPVQDDIWPGESGQGYVLRMCAQNGLGGVTRVKDMLGITRYQTLDAQAASQLAHWFGAEVQHLSLALENKEHGRRVHGSSYMGHVLGRSYFLNELLPRVCPDCLRDFGYCRAAWDFTLNVTLCISSTTAGGALPSLHVHAAMDATRPDLCDCGHPWFQHDLPATANGAELLIARAIDQRMEDGTQLASGMQFNREDDDDDLKMLPPSPKG